MIVMRFADRVLYEDNHLLIVDKPAPLATMGTPAGEESLIDLAKQYIKDKYRKPGNVYLGIVSRLDSMVTGALVLSRTSKSAARMNKLFASGQVKKTYWALVQPGPAASTGEWTDWVEKNELKHRMQVTSSSAQSAKQARLAYRVLKRSKGASLVEVDLRTGRKHQIRVQFSSRGCPVVGDRKYGGPSRFQHGIALHSREVQFEHPVKKTDVRIVAPLPPYWAKWEIVDKRAD